jgi:hypothetical protein
MFLHAGQVPLNVTRSEILAFFDFLRMHFSSRQNNQNTL